MWKLTWTWSCSPRALSGRTPLDVYTRLLSLPTVELSDAGILFACADTHREIVVFLGDARVAVSEKRTGEVWVLATVDGGCRCAGSPEQMGRDVYTDRFTSDFRDQGTEVFSCQSPAGG